MKKRYYIIILLIIVLCILIINHGKSNTYPFGQDFANIEKVELLKNDDATKNKDFTFTVLYTLKDNEINDFLKKFRELDCSQYFNDPADNYGILVIRIYYNNGDIEMIGSNNNAYISGSKTSRGRYWFKDEEFYDLFADYIDEDNLPDI